MKRLILVTLILSGGFAANKLNSAAAPARVVPEWLRLARLVDGGIYSPHIIATEKDIETKKQLIKEYLNIAYNTFPRAINAAGLQEGARWVEGMQREIKRRQELATDLAKRFAPELLKESDIKLSGGKSDER